MSNARAGTRAASKIKENKYGVFFGSLVVFFGVCVCHAIIVEEWQLLHAQERVIPSNTWLFLLHKTELPFFSLFPVADN